MSSAFARGSAIGGEAGSAGEWTWTDAKGPGKTIPLRAITLRLSPSVLHRFDIGDLRAAGRRAAHPESQRIQVTGDHQPSSSATTKPAVPTEFIDPRLLVLSAPQPVVPLGGQASGAGGRMISPVPGAAFDALFAENDALSALQPSATNNFLSAQPIEQPFTLYQTTQFSTNDIDGMSSSANTNNFFPAIPTDYFERAPTPDFSKPWVYTPDGARLLPGTVFSPETLHIPRMLTPPQSLYGNHQQQCYDDNSVVPRQDLLHNNHQQNCQNTTFLPRPDTLRQDQLYSDNQQRQQLAAVPLSPNPYYQFVTTPPHQDTLRQDQSYNNHQHQYRQSEAFPFHQDTLRQDTLRQDPLNDNNQQNHHPNTAAMRDFPTPFEYLLDPYVDVTHHRAVQRDRRQQEYEDANINRRPAVIVPNLDPSIPAPQAVPRTSTRNSSNNFITRMVHVDEYNNIALSYTAVEGSVVLERPPQMDRGRRRHMAIDEIVWDNMQLGMNYAAYRRQEDARYERCCHQGLAQACVTEKQARDRSRGRYVEINNDGERGAYQLLSAGSGGSGSNGGGVNGIVVRQVKNRDIRRQGVWCANTQQYQVGRGIGEHWKTVDQWKEVLRSGGIGFDERARRELGIGTLQPGQLSEREIKQLLADKIGNVDDGPDEELNGLFGVGTFREIGQYDVRPPPLPPRPTGQTSMDFSTTTGETEEETSTLNTEMNSDGDVDMESE